MIRRPLLVALLAASLLCGALGGTARAVTFSVGMPAGQSITMDDAIAPLTFTVTNTHATAFITQLRFTFTTTQYWPEWDTQPPNTNWTVTRYSANYIDFTTAVAGARIAPGASLNFTISMKGQNWNNLPRSASDQNDTLASVRAWGSDGTSPTIAAGLPTWPRYSLAVTMVAYPDIINIGQSATLLMQVENRSTAAQSAITANPNPPTITFTGGAALTQTSGPIAAPSPLTLNAGAQGTITYTYRADAAGTAAFSGGASRAGASSRTAASNVIAIAPLAVQVSAAPLSIISGQQVTPLMRVQNTGRGTALQSSIGTSETTIPVASTAGFPTAGTIAIGGEDITYTSVTAGSFAGCSRGANGTTPAAHVVPIAVSFKPTETTLSGDLTAAAVTIPVASTAGFPTIGSLLIDGEEIFFTGLTAASFTGCTRGVSGTLAAAHGNTSIVRSAILTMSFGNIIPTLASSGTAVSTLTSGPAPTVIGSLSLGQSGSFAYGYQVTGTQGQTYQYQGFATADGPVTSNNSTSPQGSISSFIVPNVAGNAVASYSTTISPDTVPTANGATTFRFTYYNGNLSANQNDRVTGITLYWPTGWPNNPTITRCPACSCSGWTTGTGGSATFSTNSAATGIPAGGSCFFDVRFTNTPAVTNDTSYTFYSDLTRRTSTFLTTLQTVATVTANRIVLTANPTTIAADGTATATITATLTGGGAPLAGRTIVFSTTAGRLGPTQSVTNAAGVATVTLTAPISATNLVALVTGTYIRAQGTTTVTLTGAGATPNLQYRGGTLFVAPTSSPYISVREACPGGTYSFELDVINYGTAAMNLTTASYFRFADAGGNVMTAYLNAAAAVGAGAQQHLAFGSPTNAGGGGGVVMNSAMSIGAWLPTLFLTNGVTPQNRNVADRVSVVSCGGGASGGHIRIMRWREVVQ
jgi:hypothetical protein